MKSALSWVCLIHVRTSLIWSGLWALSPGLMLPAFVRLVPFLAYDSILKIEAALLPKSKHHTTRRYVQEESNLHSTTTSESKLLWNVKLWNFRIEATTLLRTWRRKLVCRLSSVSPPECLIFLNYIKYFGETFIVLLKLKPNIVGYLKIDRGHAVA
jgi:hypothetical protein